MSSRRAWRDLAGVAALVTLAALAPACGRKTAPKPPELVVPETISTLAAENGPDGVLLTWKRPNRYVDGSRMRDLASFRIERRRGATGQFELRRQLDVKDRDRFRQLRNFKYLDACVAEGESSAYRVSSVTLDGDVSAPSNTVEIERHLPLPSATPR